MLFALLILAGVQNTPTWNTKVWDLRLSGDFIATFDSKKECEGAAKALDAQAPPWSLKCFPRWTVREEG